MHLGNLKKLGRKVAETSLMLSPTLGLVSSDRFLTWVPSIQGQILVNRSYVTSFLLRYSKDYNLLNSIVEGDA